MTQFNFRVGDFGGDDEGDFTRSDFFGSISMSDLDEAELDFFNRVM